MNKLNLPQPNLTKKTNQNKLKTNPCPIQKALNSIRNGFNVPNQKKIDSRHKIPETQKLKPILILKSKKETYKGKILSSKQAEVRLEKRTNKKRLFYQTQTGKRSVTYQIYDSQI